MHYPLKIDTTASIDFQKIICAEQKPRKNNYENREDFVMLTINVLFNLLLKVSTSYIICTNYN